MGSRDLGTPPVRPQLVAALREGPSGPPAVAVAVVRTPAGWTVVHPRGADAGLDLVEGLTLADLIAEELGAMPEPDRTARRSARGSAASVADAGDPGAVRIAALERTVAQLEHALAARVSTERAIGVLVERHGLDSRAAFEALRGEARRQGRAVAELAREVLDGASDPVAGGAATPPARVRPSTRVPTPGVLPPRPRPPAYAAERSLRRRPGMPAADGVS